MKRALRFVLAISILTTVNSVRAQQDNWYVLQIMQPVDQVQIKSILEEINGYYPDAQVWYNGEKSNTIGCKRATITNWSQVLFAMLEHDVYLADITQGVIHQSGNLAPSGYFFIQACYYASHTESTPPEFLAQLNHDEWDYLPEEVRNYYLTYGNYEWVEK